MTEKKNILQVAERKYGAKSCFDVRGNDFGERTKCFFFPLNKRKQLYHACDKCQIPF